MSHSVAAKRGAAPPTIRRNARARLRMSLAVAGMVATVALLGVPRGVPVEDVPLPRIERRLLALELREDEQLAAEALSGLPFIVRASGEVMRRVGAAEARNDKAAVQELRDQLIEMIQVARSAHGERPLLSLRAIQTHLFLEELGRYVLHRRPSRDLTELGGAILTKARRAGWLQHNRWKASDEELGAMFRVRWTNLAGVTEPGPLAPRLNDLRLYYRLRLRYPDVNSRARSDRIEAQLRDVSALSELDRDYPHHYATGILQYQLGSLGPALDSFRAHLRQHPDGEWALRARNYATACADALFQ